MFPSHGSRVSEQFRNARRVQHCYHAGSLHPSNNRTGYVQTWHFTVERELAHNFLLDVAYLGNHAVGLMILADANQAAPSTAAAPNLSVNARRPIPNFTTIEEAFAGGFGSYNAFQAKIEKRYSGGLYFINSFTWSKAIDNALAILKITTAITRALIYGHRKPNAASRVITSPSITQLPSCGIFLSATAGISICKIVLLTC